MKTILKVVALGAFLVFGMTQKANSQVQARTNYAAYLSATNDTLTNADTTTYTVSVTGKKSTISFQTNITKISGTVGGTIKIYGSVDGTNYATTALTTINLTDASANHATVYTSNGYQKYRYQIITSGTQACWQKTYVLYRE